MHIGEIIRSLRKEKHMKLIELSAKSGVALGSLSRIENGRVRGTLKSHDNICRVFGISLSDLYRDLPQKKLLEIKAKKIGPITSIYNKRFSSEVLVSSMQDKRIIPLLIKITKGGRTTLEKLKPDIQKFIYVLEGKIEANIGEERYMLGPGHSIYFDASAPHYFKSVGDESRFICIICPPIIL